MKKLTIIIFTFVLCIVSVSCSQTKYISVPFKLSDVKTVELFHFNVPVDAEKKVITKQEDIADIYKSLGSIPLKKDKITKTATGGSVTSLRFNLSNGTSYEIIYSKSPGLAQRIYFSDSSKYYSTSADIEEIWFNCDSKIEKVSENELPYLSK